jgi:hypothetical protein
LKKITFLLALLLAFSLLLSACRSSSGNNSNEKDSAAVLTEAAVTADAILRTMSASSPTPAPVTPTSTATQTPEPSSTPIPGISTLPGGTPAPSSGDKAEFVADLTIPDGTVFAPNATFVKTWRLKNAGLTTWTPSYTVVYYNGDDLKAPASVALPATVAPGQTVDVSLPMTAPTKDGTYTANFLLSNASGSRFGLDPGGVQPFYVVIVVDAKEGTPAASPTPTTPTVGPSVTPGTGGNIVNWVFLSVDNANANTCPHTFNFTGQITLNNPATVTYRLEVLSNDSSQPAPTLDPVTVVLPVGQHVVSFPLTFPVTFNGVARLHVSAPEDIYSNPVNLVLACPTPAVYPTP